MEDLKAKKFELRAEMLKKCQAMDEEAYQEKSRQVSDKLLDFANFQEAKTVLLYLSHDREVDTSAIIQESFDTGKIVLLPVLHPKTYDLVTFKVDTLDKGLRENAYGRMEPDPRFCKVVPLDYIDLAVIPGVVFDERGGRVGSGRGSYDRLIPQLPMTTRKVALAMEEQIVPQAPMEAHDRYIDIIITQDRVIYKI